MRIVELGNLLVQGFPMPGASASSGVPDGDYIGFAVGPDSLVDLLRVDGKVVGPGAVLPLRSRKPVVEAVRGPANLGGTFVDQTVSRAQLVCYECGDALVPLGPRRSHAMQVVTSYSTTDIVAPNPATVLRLPFAGRRMAQFVVRKRQFTGTVATITANVVGVRYHLRDVMLGALTLGDESPRYDLSSGHVIPGSAGNTADVWYEGGTDSAEAYDELQLQVTASAGGDTVTIIAYAEAWD